MRASLTLLRHMRPRGLPLHVRAKLAFTILLLTAAPACSDGGSGPADDNCRSAGLRLNVSDGLTPTFTWTPSCRVANLEVLNWEGEPIWFIQPTGRAGIASGVVYGVVPAGAIASAAAVPLVSGQPHYVAVRYGRPDNLDVAALAAFEP